MRVTVAIPTAFRRFTAGAASIECTVVRLAELLAHLEQQFPGLKPHLRDDSGRLRPFINIYVNEEDIRFLGGDNYHFKDGDEVMLVPSIAGGRPAEPATVTVPATSANLGCAFDCAALALNLYLCARATSGTEPGVRVHYRGPNPDRVPLDASNLVVRGIVRFAAARSKNVSGLAVDIENQIPVGVGLGSSAAAVVAGLLLGAQVLEVQPEMDEILLLAAELEGHPDNVAAACHGGLAFAAVVEGSSRVLSARSSVPPELRIVAVVPDVAVPTPAARAILPTHYSRADVVHNLQRVSLLAALSFSGHMEWVPELFRDRLHQPYRCHAVPGIAECLELRHPDLLGVFLSGSGSGVLAFARDREKEIGAALAEIFARRNVHASVLFLRAENRGARIGDAPVISPPQLISGADEQGAKRAHVGVEVWR